MPSQYFIRDGGTITQPISSPQPLRPPSRKLFFIRKDVALVTQNQVETALDKVKEKAEEALVGAQEAATEARLRSRPAKKYKPHIFDTYTVTTVGGSAIEEFSVPKISVKDYVDVQLKALGATPVMVLAAECFDGGIRVTFSGDPSDDHVVGFHTIWS